MPRVMPPVYFFGSLALAALLRYAIPGAAVIPHPWHLLGIVPVIGGFALVVLPAQTFQSRGTAIRPFEDSFVLVQDGFFAVSRNPMYVGMVLACAGAAILLQRVAPFVAPLILAIVLQTRFIRHEEAALESRFGDEYRSYKARVRRWI